MVSYQSMIQQIMRLLLIFNNFGSIKQIIQIMSVLFQVQKYGEPNVMLSILGNKSDVQQGKINTENVLNFCKSKNISHYQVSAKTGQSVTNAFQQLSRKLTKIHPKIEKKETQNQVVANVLKKKEQFKLKSGADKNKAIQKKKCC